VPSQQAFRVRAYESEIFRFCAVPDVRACYCLYSVNLNLHIPWLLRIAGFALSLLFPALACSADDKPRVSIAVTKKSAGRPISKSAAGVETGRTQALFAVVENSSVRTFPEGSLRWTAVVRKSSGGMLKYSGAESVKSLRSFQSVEIPCGLFEIDTRPGTMSRDRDRIDFEMVYVVEENEIVRTSSTANFAVLAQKAQSVFPEAEPGAMKPEDAAPRKRPAEEKPAMPPLIGAEKMPPKKPALPAAEITRPADALPPPNQPFDFFNLRGKMAPAAK